jgi:hypothetical protein
MIRDVVQYRVVGEEVNSLGRSEQRLFVLRDVQLAVLAFGSVYQYIISQPQDI